MNTTFSGLGRKLVCVGQLNTIFGWTRWGHMSSRCVSSYQPITALTDLPLTFDLVLNPAICLVWIQAQWETEYVQRSEDIILKIISIT